MFKNLFNKKKEDYVEVSRENVSLFDDLLKKILQEKHIEAKRPEINYISDVKLPSLESYQKIKKFSLVQKKTFAYWMVQKLVFSEKKRTKKDYFLSEESHLTIDILNNFFRGNLGLNEQDFIFFIEFFKIKKFSKHSEFFHWPTSLLILQIERYQKKTELSKNFKAFLSKLLKDNVFTKTTYYYKDEINKIKNRISKILNNSSNEFVRFNFADNDRLGKIGNELLDTINDNQLVVITNILDKCKRVNNAKPTQKFLKETANFIDEFKPSDYKTFLKTIFNAVINLEVIEVNKSYTYGKDIHYYSDYEFLEKQNATTIKGLIWTATRFHEKELLNIIYKLCLKSFKKIPGKGPTAQAIGNACINYLSNSKGIEGVSQLTLIKQKVTQKSTKDLIDKYITEISKKSGLTKADLEESVVPDFKLNLGKKEYNFKDYSFQIEIERIGNVTSKWIKPDGKTQKTTPSFVKNNKVENDKLKKVKTEIREIKNFVTAQRNRLDALLIEEKVIPFTNFYDYYFNHGLVSFIARKLIWIIKNAKKESIAFYHNNKWMDANQNEISITKETTFQLWHPIYSKTETIVYWRDFLIDNQIVQPLKQAFREIYLLTDAEINTKEYSNRMSAHILKQHQFSTLAKMRGWNYQLIGAWDHGSDCIARREISENITAEFWLNEILDNDQFNDAGILYYMSTDQVRFTNNEETIDMVDVPAIIFTEIMRDVDLFVGVSSVGNDPQWADNAGLPQYRNYWTSYSFGDLTEVAKTRKTILENLVPRLKINKVAKIEGKFLIIKGKIRTYNIHIGSTNIQMEPNNQYLCIVANNKKDVTKNVFLPFEGDKGLSIILSKAFLLSEDDKITDPTIISQLKHN